jgi:hypothetical protein
VKRDCAGSRSAVSTPGRILEVIDWRTRASRGFLVQLKKQGIKVLDCVRNARE